MTRFAIRTSIGAAVLVSAVALGAGAYLAWPQHPAMSLPATPAIPVAGDIGVLAERLAKRLQDRDPEDGAGWALLGRSYVMLGRNDEALAAFERARRLLGDSDAQLAADYAAAKSTGAARRPAAGGSSMLAR